MNHLESNLRKEGIRALILDYGEALCRRPTPDKLDRMARIAGLDIETFTARYHHERGPYDRSVLSPAEYWKRVVAAPTGPDGDMLAALRQLDVEMWSDIDPDMTQWLADARTAGLKTALLSNMHADMASHARRSFDWLQALDCVVLSCEIRLIKPEREIYDRCLEILNLQSDEVCFVDDRIANVEGARKAGWAALRFQTVEQLRNDLRDLGFPVLPPAVVDSRE